MAGIARTLEGLRLTLLVVTVPYAALWAEFTGSGGWVMVLTYALLVLFYALRVDAAMTASGRDPRLGLLTDRFAMAHVPTGIARFIVADLLVALALVLVIVSPAVGVCSAVAMVLVLVWVRTGPDRRDVRRFQLAEWWWPVCLLLIPMLIVGLQGWIAQAAVPAEPSDGAGSAGAAASVDPMSARVIAATCLGALMLGVFAAVCQTRDEIKDRGDGFRTTPTAVGRGGAVMLILLLTFAAVWLAARGVGREWWGWHTTMYVAWTPAAVFAAMSANRDGIAAGLAWAGAATTALSVAMWSPSVALSPPPSLVPSEATPAQVLREDEAARELK